MLLPVRIAALDLGSNSFHALVVDVTRNGALEVVARAKRMPRIGEEIFRTGKLSDSARTNALLALSELVPVVERTDPNAVVAVATSALRDADNGRSFLDEVRARFGIEVRMISGDEEAQLAYAGARARLGADRDRITLFDLGGGSLEMVIGEGERILHTRSAPIGVLRAVAANPLSDPAAPRELRALEQWARRQVTALVEPARKQRLGEVVLCAGTARAVRSVAREIALVPETGPGADRLKRSTLRTLIDWLAPLPLGARRTVPGLDPGRVDLIVHGAVMLDAILAVTGAASARVCRAALREGLVLEHVGLGAVGSRARRRRAVKLAA
jgi:exopolyphosphatase/guanosine-5'-triphosphate,3'-diphosphate pyrophosphatase